MIFHLYFLGPMMARFRDFQRKSLKLDYTRRARWPFSAFCVDGLPQITSYWCNYIKLAEIGNRADPAIGKRDRHTDGRTDGHTDGRTDTRTNKHQILGTLYTKGPKGQLSFQIKILQVPTHPKCSRPARIR